MHSSSEEIPRLIAFYLPQYHPIPENDEWWGKGFTEWFNVTRSKPRFVGHYQPHLPADLGFYDLRVSETREEQANLARAYGIYGFCYYHYWFAGRRILERPLNEVLASGKPDFPFCICWANENWTRRWDGADTEVLLAQDYSAEDDKRHIESLIPILHDHRYIRVNGLPLVAIYRLGHLPRPQQTAEIWRSVAVKSGLPGLHLCNVESSGTEHGLASRYGLDAAIEFAPDWTVLPAETSKFQSVGFFHKLFKMKTRDIRNEDYIGDYNQLADNMMRKVSVSYQRYPCVTPMWDNSARRKTGATILSGSSPEKYEEWLRHSVHSVKHLKPEQRIVFINAWNEWAEGNHLEPCEKWGRAYLESTNRALGSAT